MGYSLGCEICQERQIECEASRKRADAGLVWYSAMIVTFEALCVGASSGH
jgi:hypothetical protein